MDVRLNELRLAIHMMHDCEVDTVADVVQVRVPCRGGKAWEGLVHVFKITGSPKATRCYAWPEEVNNTTLIIMAVLHSKTISSAQRAVQSIMS